MEEREHAENAINTTTATRTAQKQGH